MPKRVLFVCSHNANRSIAAEAIARHLRPELEVESAGVDAAGKLNPVMIEALKTRGYPTDHARSKGIADETIGGLENNWDLIVMMGCLPNLPKVDLPETTTVEDWGLPDPAAHPELMDSVIEKIVEKVKAI
ncbi:unnamed protein product [Closterium sp. Yama58-4]|nr:unnamed protein product [Closterium sp. Yama58-4]